MTSNIKNWGLTICVLLLAGSALLPDAYAQKVEGKQSTSTPLKLSEQNGSVLDLEMLKDKRAAIESKTDLSPTLKARIIKHVDGAIRFQEIADRLSREIEEFSKILNSAPGRIKQIKSELQKQPLPAESLFQTDKDMQTAKLEQLLREEEAVLMNLKAAEGNWKDQLNRQKASPENLPQQISEANQRLADIQKELDTPPVPDENPIITDARSTALQTEKAMIQMQIRLYDQQLAGQVLLYSLITAEHDLAVRRITADGNRLKIRQNMLQNRRQQEAKKDRKDAEKAKEKAPEILPIVREQFDINIKLGKELENLAKKEAPVVQEMGNLQTQLKELKLEFEIARERVASVVLTEAIGLGLREQRRLLPSKGAYRLESTERQLEMSAIQEAQIALDRKRREFSNINPLLKKLISSASYLPKNEVDRLSSDLRELLNKRRDLMQKLKEGYTRVFKHLRNMEYAEQQLVTVADDFADFLDRHLLWMRSSKPLHLEDLSKMQVAIGWFLDLHMWQRMFLDVKISFKKNIAVWVLGLLLAGLILAGRKWARRQLNHIGNQVNRQEKDSFGLTIEALGLTCYLAIGWPYIIGFFAFQMRRLPAPYVFTAGISNGLWNAAVMLLFLLLFQISLKPGGLTQIHFRWREAARTTFLRNLRWAVPLVILGGTVVAVMDAAKELDFSDSLAKLALIIQALTAAVFTAIALRFSGGVVSKWIKHHSGSWLARLRYFWYPLAVGLPAFLIILVAMGYYYSAVEIRNLIRNTILLLIMLVFFNDLVLRWLSLAQRKIARKEAEKKAELVAKETEGHKTPGEAPQKGDYHHAVQKPEIELSQISAQTRKLLKTTLLIFAAVGLWTIWEGVLPAFGILQDIQLWSYTSNVNGTIKSVPITLAHLALAIIVTLTTVVAAKNLPGLLEIILLNRLPMDAGARYAFTRICSYAIVILGIVMAFTTLGINWSSLQWLIAALGVGLGFGLQEIVANFVSGLIVLFERPCRVGDTVTIGETTGTVARIRIRATTIVDWDRKELIVPNKEFITGRLINWSLTDKVIRMKIPVGIAYGSDTALAEKLLLKAARANPLALKNPEPAAVFLGFGDNSLNFEVRVFIHGLDDWIRLLHSMNMAIDHEFREAGITIAFPQRDVHLDATGPFEVKVVSEDFNLKSSTLPSDSQGRPDSRT